MGQPGRASDPDRAGAGAGPERAWETAFVALGSNLGSRERLLESGRRSIAEAAGVRELRCSRTHETRAIGGPPGQGAYLNAVVVIETRRAPRDLLKLLLEIERRHGRERLQRHGPRTLDLDLLLYGERLIDEPDLVVPHPRMWARPFVMEPLREVCEPAFLERMRRRVSDAVGEGTPDPPGST